MSIVFPSPRTNFYGHHYTTLESAILINSRDTACLLSCFQYQIMKCELETRTLSVMVWHSDRFGRNDFLGEVNISLDYYSFDNPTPLWYRLRDRVRKQPRSLLLREISSVLLLHWSRNNKFFLSSSSSSPPPWLFVVFACKLVKNWKMFGPFLFRWCLFVLYILQSWVILSWIIFDLFRSVSSNDRTTSVLLRSKSIPLSENLIRH